MHSYKDSDIVITQALRTPLGSFLGKMAHLPAPDLAAHTIAKLIDATQVPPEQINELILGNVLSAGIGQAPARQAALKAQLPDSLPCTGVSKVCGSGMKAVMMGYDQIRAGSAECIIAGGMESMSLAPYLLPKARQGQRLGHGQTFDHMFLDGLQDAYNGQLMGVFADQNAATDGISREEMDLFAETSLQRAIEARENGYFAEEIVPIQGKQGRDDVLMEHDQLPETAKPEKIRSLKPAFAENGRITAANASAISDGAASLMLMRADKALELGLQPMARILAHQSYAGAPGQFTHAPIHAISGLLGKLDWSKDQVDLFEINEAFAMVTLACIKALELNPNAVNVNGGACALGHPIGASGARILVTLVHALKRLGKSRGVASLCIGGGEATALAIETL